MKKKKTTFLWILDEWKTLDHAKDTTLLLHEAAKSLGHPSFLAEASSLRLENGKGLIEVFDNPPSSMEKRTILLNSFNGQAHYRLDPPLSEAYFQPLRILWTVAKLNSKLRILNPPELLALASEKLLGLLTPFSKGASLISRDEKTLISFSNDHPHLILKPLHGAQSKGVKLWKNENDPDRNLFKLLISKTSEDFMLPILLQPYLPSIEKEGETRLWFAGGKFLGGLKKWPKEGDFRVLIDEGSLLQPLSLNAKMKSKIKPLEALHKKLGIALSAVDFIGDQIVDFNVTSPGLLRQLESLTQAPLAQTAIRRLSFF